MTKHARKPISKRIRFAVFDRDGFTCCYCGRQPPSVQLEIDHIIPVSNGGTNDQENLRTACVDCNRGKSNKSLGQIVTDRDTLARLQEAEEARAAAKAMRAAARARDKMRQECTNQICYHTSEDACKRASTTTLVNMCVEFGPSRVFEWLEHAAAVVGRGLPPNETNMVKYLCGIAKHKREELSKCE